MPMSRNVRPASAMIIRFSFFVIFKTEALAAQSVRKFFEGDREARPQLPASLPDRKPSFPRLDLRRAMEVGVRDQRKSAGVDFFEKFSAGGDFPSVEVRREFVTPIPERVGLFLEHAGRNRM